MDVLYARPDGSFVIEKGGLPYHVLPDDPLFQEVAEAAAGLQLPPEPRPSVLPMLVASITRRQLRLWLLQQGKTAADVQAAINAIADPTARAVATIEWEDSTSYDRAHPLISAIGAALGFTAEQIDAGFAAAATL